MRARIVTLTATAMLIAGLALADPRVLVRYHDGVPQVTLTGDFSNTRYTVWRAVQAPGPFVAISALDVLCLGSCYVDDYDALPGRTYWYRFDVVALDGTRASFGPYAVTLSATELRRLGATVIPNPARGPARIDLYLAGHPGEPPLAAEAALFDLQGRKLRTLYRGELARGRTTVSWDGRDDQAREVGAGLYFLRLATPVGTSVTRVLRAR
jgi:hypothetical protein